MRLAVLLLVAACGVDGSDTPPDRTQRTFDLRRCTAERWSEFLPLGSAWVEVRPDDTHCVLTLGGETENPLYDGSPTQICTLARRGTVTITLASGGPARLDHPACARPD